MSASCCDQALDPHRGDERYRRAVWAVLTINAAMFSIAVAAGLAAGSASLQADALDFLGDARNYAISLFVVGMVCLKSTRVDFSRITQTSPSQPNMSNAATMSAWALSLRSQRQSRRLASLPDSF
jgi:hypothetical protein